MPGDPSKSGFIYRRIIWWGGLLVRTYHRLEIVGEVMPESTPVLAVQNHTNGLIDAHILMSTTPRPLRLLVKYTLISAPVIGWMLRNIHAVPVYRQKDGVDTRKNADSFEAINQTLRDRAVIALFPEGESLNSIGLRKLRSGVARMGINAELSVEGGIGVQIVPVGVTYEYRDRLRGLASAIVGPPIDVAPILAEHGNEPSRDAVKAVLDRTSAEMRKLILHCDTQEEYDTATALERLLPRTGTPIGIRRQQAQTALRADKSKSAPERREAIRELAQRFEAARLTGDDVLGPAPTAVSTYAPMILSVPVILFCLPFWAPISLFAVFISRFPKSPDKASTLRVLFGYLALVLLIPVTALVGALLGGWPGVGIALAAYWLSCQIFVPALDAWLASTKKMRRRALEKDQSALESLRASIHSIREAYAQA
jgi:1-acyl-sn-glycerol-3-phosphate acyltransferase